MTVTIEKSRWKLSYRLLSYRSYTTETDFLIADYELCALVNGGARVWSVLTCLSVCKILLCFSWHCLHGLKVYSEIGCPARKQLQHNFLSSMNVDLFQRMSSETSYKHTMRDCLCTSRIGTRVDLSYVPLPRVDTKLCNSFTWYDAVFVFYSHSHK